MKSTEQKSPVTSPQHEQTSAHLSPTGDWSLSPVRPIAIYDLTPWKVLLLSKHLHLRTRKQSVNRVYYPSYHFQFKFEQFCVVLSYTGLCMCACACVCRCMYVCVCVCVDFISFYSFTNSQDTAEGMGSRSSSSGKELQTEENQL